MLLSYRQIAGAIYYRSDDHLVLRFRIKAEKRRARTRNSGNVPKPSKMTQSRARTASLAGAGAPSRRGTECWIRTTWLHVRMGDDNILAEKEFDISLDGQTDKVKASAMFLIHDVAPQERGIYILNFTLGGQHAETTQPDKTYYSREQARQAVELAFSSGQVESYAKRQIQSWLNLGH